MGRRRAATLTAALVGLLVGITPVLDARAAEAGLVSSAVLDGGVLRQTHAYAPGGNANLLDVYVPADAPLVPRPTVVFIHGGSWAIGDKSEWATEAIAVAKRGWTAASINYRLSGDAPWPAQQVDASAALAYLQRNAAVLGIDAARIGALGDSAGGHLAALLGRARTGQAPLRGVVTMSGVNDLTGLLQQRSAGGCPTTSCVLDGLALRVSRDLMRCLPTTCASSYRAASPGAAVTSTTPATIAFNSEGELIDPRQAWIMDTNLRRAGRPSRVHVLPGRLHARGYQAQAFEPAMRFLAAVLTPETAPEYPRPKVTTTLDLPTTTRTRVGEPVRFKGVVRPRAYGSSVAVQVRGGDGIWRTVRTTPLLRGQYDTYFDTTWAPSRRGTTVWRTAWVGGGGVGISSPRTIVAG